MADIGQVLGAQFFGIYIATLQYNVSVDPGAVTSWRTRSSQ